MAVTQNSVIVRSFTEVWEDGTFAHTSSSSEVIYPGYLVYQYSGGITTGDPAALPTYRVNADINYPPVIVFENDLIGETIDDDIASGDYIRVKFLAPGEKYVVYGQATTAIAVGDLLSPHTDGKVIAHSGPGNNAQTLFRAETAVAADATDTRLVVRVLRV
jgi:hypothetical protein